MPRNFLSFQKCTDRRINAQPFGSSHRVHILTRDETGLMCLPTQLERTLQLYCMVIVNVMKGGRSECTPPPLPAWANITLMMECMPESSRCNPVYSVLLKKQKVL
jgi:hypothetical protein